MIPKDVEARIVRLLHVEKWPITTIGRECAIHHGTVRRVLLRHGVELAEVAQRPSIVDPYRPFIVEVLTRYPDLCASRVYDMVRERGYPGRPDHFRAIVAQHRPKPAAEAFLRRRTLPAEEAQMDWAHFGHVDVEGGRRVLVAFVMVLSFSRRVFLRFFHDMRVGAFLRGHVEAFEMFGGTPRVVLYDNLKSAVIARRGNAIQFNETLLELAKHQRFEPRPVAVRRGNEKGRVERAIRTVRTSFFAARSFHDLADLNTQADAWCARMAEERRVPDDHTRTIADAFDEERKLLLALPSDRFPAEDRVEVSVGKQPYVRFDSNDYTVPHDRVRRTLTVRGDGATVRVLDGLVEVARHVRSWGRGRVIEEPAHLAQLEEWKREAKQHRGLDRLHHAAPSSQAFLTVVAQRGGNLGSHTIGLLRLLERFGPEPLERAFVEAIENDTCHLAAVRQVLDRERHERGLPTPIPVALPDDPRVRDLTVRPHALGTYDRLGGGP